MNMHRKPKNILVTGGTGYIGSHFVIELLKKNYNPIIIDNLSNSKLLVLDILKKITNKNITFHKGDIQDRSLIRRIFSSNEVSSVIHFAGLKSVGESMKFPDKYYENNVIGSKILIEESLKSNVKNFIFSSSATVYGDPKELPINEKHELAPINPYGQNKVEVEKILEYYWKKYKFSSVSLRYFNPIGAHNTGLLGEFPSEKPNNLLPYICKVANKELSHLEVFGDDFQTKDGTGIRDYIHIEDLVSGHLKALDFIKKNDGCIVVNLGTGQGYSVFEIIKTFEKVNKVKVSYKVVDRRPGDSSEVYADPQLAQNLFSWKSKKQLEDMLKDSWKWQINFKNILK